MDVLLLLGMLTVPGLIFDVRINVCSMLEEVLQIKDEDLVIR